MNGVADIPNNIVYTVQGQTKYRIRTKTKYNIVTVLYTFVLVNVAISYQE